MTKTLIFDEIYQFCTFCQTKNAAFSIRIL